MLLLSKQYSQQGKRVWGKKWGQRLRGDWGLQGRSWDEISNKQVWSRQTNPGIPIWDLLIFHLAFTRTPEMWIWCIVIVCTIVTIILSSWLRLPSE